MSFSSLHNVYNDFKVFNYPDFIKNIESGNNYPLHIRIKPINACNQKCYYCSYRNAAQSLGKDMKITDFIPYPKMMETIDDIIDMKVKAVTFSGGGEPTIYKGFVGVVAKLAKSPVRFAMLTNGVKLKDMIAYLFASYGSWVRISIDGWDRKSYKKYRGADNFDTVMENIMNFHSEKCYLGLNIVVLEDNAEHLYDIVKLVSKSEVKTIKISPCVVHDNLKENIFYHSSLNKIVDEEIKRIRSDFKIPINYTYHDQLCGFEKDYDWCPNIQMQPVIGADQNIYVCHDKAYDLPLGLLASFKDKSFKKAWEESSKFKIDPREDCKHHCMAHGKNTILLNYLDTIHTEFV